MNAGLEGEAASRPGEPARAGRGPHCVDPPAAFWAPGAGTCGPSATRLPKSWLISNMECTSDLHKRFNPCQRVIGVFLSVACPGGIEHARRRDFLIKSNRVPPFRAPRISGYHLICPLPYCSQSLLLSGLSDVTSFTERPLVPTDPELIHLNFGSKM